MTKTCRSRLLDWQTRHPFAILAVLFLVVWSGSVLLTIYHHQFDLRLGLLSGGFLCAGVFWLTVNKSLPVGQWIKERPFIQFLVGISMSLLLGTLILKAYYANIQFQDMVFVSYMGLLFWAIERLPADSPLAFFKDPLGIEQKRAMKLAQAEHEKLLRGRTTPPPFEGIRHD